MRETILSMARMDVHRGERRVIEGLGLAVRAGEVYALLGSNGAGKTTTLNALLGFVHPSAGEVAVCGLSPTRQPAQVRQLLAYLPENVALYPYLSGAENLQFFGALAGRRIGAREAQALLARAGLPQGWAARPTSAYSKGMRQKVGLAIAYAKSARAMLLDEPTSGLDPAAARELALRLREAASGGLAILMATHDLAHVLLVADAIGILRAGRLVAEFPASGLDVAELERRYLAHAPQGEEMP